MGQVGEAKANAAAAYRLKENGLRLFTVRAVVMDRDPDGAHLRVLITIRWRPEPLGSSPAEERDEAFAATLAKGRLTELRRGW